MLQQRFRVLGPKYDKACVFIRNIAICSIERVAPCRISNLQSVEKPVGIKGRNVSAPTRRNNLWSLGINPFSISLLNIYFLPSHCNISYTIKTNSPNIQRYRKDLKHKQICSCIYEILKTVLSCSIKFYS